MKKIGIIDLGSNTARLVVYAYEPGEWFYLADQIREPVRLAEGLAATGVLGEAHVRRAAALRRLRQGYGPVPPARRGDERRT